MVKTIVSRSALLAFSFAVTALSSQHTMAQSTTRSVVQAPSSAADVAKGPQLEEILVTARKTTERLQDIPMSLAVVTSEGIEKTGAITLEDLGRAVPGLTIVSVWK
jgi:iron complex outermembrane receptor protein